MEIASLSKWRADEFGAFSGAIADFRIPFTQAIVDDVLALDVLPRMPTLRRLELTIQPDNHLRLLLASARRWLPALTVPLVVERRILPGLRLHLHVAGGGLVSTLASFVGDAAANRIPGVRMEGREIELDLAALLFPADVDTALRYSVATSLAGIIGCLVIAFTIDSIGRRVAISVALALSSLPLFMLASTGATTAGTVLLLSATAAVFIFSVNLALYVWTAELYPTRMRALGCSVGGAFGRGGIVLGPLLVGQLLERGLDISDIFTVLGAVAVVGAVSTAVLGVETKEKQLEEISR